MDYRVRCTWVGILLQCIELELGMPFEPQLSPVYNRSSHRIVVRIKGGAQKESVNCLTHDAQLTLAVVLTVL